MLGHICVHCKSNNTQVATDFLYCLTCGGRTGADGEAMPKEPIFDGGKGRPVRPQ